MKWIQKIAQHSGRLQVDFIPTGFLLSIFLLPWMHARQALAAVVMLLRLQGA